MAALTATVDDNLALSDGVVRDAVQVTGRSTVGLSDALSPILTADGVSITRQISDSVALADSAVRDAVQVSGRNNVGLSDVVTTLVFVPAVPITVTINDGIGLSDPDESLDFAETQTDAIGLVDNVLVFGTGSAGAGSAVFTGSGTLSVTVTPRPRTTAALTGTGSLAALRAGTGVLTAAKVYRVVSGAWVQRTMQRL